MPAHGHTIKKAILNKPGKLTDREFDAVKMHPELGVAIVQGDRRMNRMVTELVRSVADEEPPELGPIRMMGASLGSDLSNLHNDEEEEE